MHAVNLPGQQQRPAWIMILSDLATESPLQDGWSSFKKTQPQNQWPGGSAPYLDNCRSCRWLGRKASAISLKSGRRAGVKSTWENTTKNWGRNEFPGMKFQKQISFMGVESHLGDWGFRHSAGPVLPHLPALAFSTCFPLRWINADAVDAVDAMDAGIPRPCWKLGMFKDTAHSARGCWLNLFQQWIDHGSWSNGSNGSNHAKHGYQMISWLNMAEYGWIWLYHGWSHGWSYGWSHGTKFCPPKFGDF